MRTTVNIDDELLTQAKMLAARTSRSLGAVVDDALRVLLKAQSVSAEQTGWRLPSANLGRLQPGVDLEDKESLANVLGDNDLS
ncbi:DUF2191 domain-containing protein [Skermania sp. ID1734]|uniref:type II toxin-antitoxin system VapB family antitoxin n=1 Tax=Skermania sp. ID1734 TaxID=2597516 RepID=UPI001180D776|nr:type II toxin-antitoxin system VapB family antitoxin [Skermania sp. ID1734]TSD95305.1 DUF2191 domain-containing protein [Skermania sp. ID1734]